MIVPAGYAGPSEHLPERPPELAHDPEAMMRIALDIKPRGAVEHGVGRVLIAALRPAQPHPGRPLPEEVPDLPVHEHETRAGGGGGRGEPADVGNDRAGHRHSTGLAHPSSSVTGTPRAFASLTSVLSFGSCRPVSTRAM